MIKEGNILVPKIMIGTFRAGNKNMIKDMICTAVERGCYGIDTSPSYGTEKYVGYALNFIINEYKINREKLVVADKIDGWQMFQGKGNIEKYVDKSLKLLKLDYIDILHIHWPFKKYLLETYLSMEKLIDTGKIKKIGLCNINRRIYEEILENQINIKPFVVQNEISPLYTDEKNIEYFKSKDIAIQAYSPLARMISEIKESEVLLELSNKYNKSIPQIILRWHIQKDITPIFTSTKPNRVIHNLDIFDFNISEEEVKKIDKINKNFKIFPESYGCPGY